MGWMFPFSPCSSQNLLWMARESSGISFQVTSRVANRRRRRERWISTMQMLQQPDDIVWVPWQTFHGSTWFGHTHQLLSKPRVSLYYAFSEHFQEVEFPAIICRTQSFWLGPQSTSLGSLKAKAQRSEWEVCVPIWDTIFLGKTNRAKWWRLGFFHFSACCNLHLQSWIWG